MDSPEEIEELPEVIRNGPYDLNWLMEKHPEAYEDLPEPYKNDSCLVFGYDYYGYLCARSAPGQENILGDKTWYYHGRKTIAHAKELGVDIPLWSE